MLKFYLLSIWNTAIDIVFDKKSTKEIHSLLEQKEKPKNI